MDFTRKKYTELLVELKKAGYRFKTYSEYCLEKPTGRFVVVRHDVDLRPDYSLATAKIEHGLGVRAVYYFRAVPESWDENIIKEIASLGHEIGYHYESLTTCNGDVEAAYIDFCDNLRRLRGLAEVKTICMHGSPKSPYDSKDIWKKHSFKELSIIGEPYLTTDFSTMLYLTDTGRRWDGYKVSVRDKVAGYQEQWCREGYSYHATNEIIGDLQQKLLPEQLMLTTHPQRWMNFGLGWLKELALQNAKNVVKSWIVRKNRKKGN